MMRGLIFRKPIGRYFAYSKDLSEPEVQVIENSPVINSTVVNNTTQGGTAVSTTSNPDATRRVNRLGEPPATNLGALAQWVGELAKIVKS